MNIREAESRDWQAIWPFFKDIVRAGDTYGFDPAMNEKEAQTLWIETPHKTYICESNGMVLGSYYIKQNQAGPGAHVCNCGYMVSKESQGKGVATSMCEHSQLEALKLGYKAMQFNFVASTNERAVRLWQKLGFNTVGHLPKAFRHPSKGFIDAYVMYKWLEKD